MKRLHELSVEERIRRSDEYKVLEGILGLEEEGRGEKRVRIPIITAMDLDKVSKPWMGWAWPKRR